MPTLAHRPGCSQPHAVRCRRPADHRAAEVHGAAQTRCRELDAEHSPLPGAAAGTRYPAPAEQVARGLRGPVLCAYEEAVGAADGGRMHGIAVGSWLDCSAEVDALLAGEAADAMAAAARSCNSEGAGFGSLRTERDPKGHATEGKERPKARKERALGVAGGATLWRDCRCNPSSSDSAPS